MKTLEYYCFGQQPAVSLTGLAAPGNTWAVLVDTEVCPARRVKGVKWSNGSKVSHLPLLLGPGPNNGKLDLFRVSGN